MDQRQVESELDAWLQQQAGTVDPEEALALDGKHLRNSYDRDKTPDRELARQQLTARGLPSGDGEGELVVCQSMIFGSADLSL